MKGNPLPAVQADGDIFESGQCLVSEHAKGGIALFGERVGFLDLSSGWFLHMLKSLKNRLLDVEGGADGADFIGR